MFKVSLGPTLKHFYNDNNAKKTHLVGLAFSKQLAKLHIHQPCVCFALCKVNVTLEFSSAATSVWPLLLFFARQVK